MPVAMNCCGDEVSTPPAPALRTTVAEGGLMVSEVRPSMGGGPTMPPKPPRPVVLPLPPVACGLVPAQLPPASVAAIAAHASKTRGDPNHLSAFISGSSKGEEGRRL